MLIYNYSENIIQTFLCVTAKFPVFSLSGKSKNQVFYVPWPSCVEM